jgi:hypothetical protein
MEHLKLAEVMTLILAFAALCATLYQIRDAVRSIRGQTYQRVYEVMIGIDRFFFDHPAYKPYFYPESGEPKYPPDDPVRLASVAEMMADYFDSVYHQGDSMPKQTSQGFREFMRSVYHHSKELQNYIRLNEKWYPEHFVKSLRETSTSAAQR